MSLPWTEELIEHQQAMSAETLEALHEHGVVDDVTLLHIEFFYDAPSSDAATTLRSFLVEETDYEVEVVRTGRWRRRQWSVVDRTRETTVSAATIRDWIRWMVSAGAEQGGCPFDGWGVHLSS